MEYSHFWAIATDPAPAERPRRHARAPKAIQVEMQLIRPIQGAGRTDEQKRNLANFDDRRFPRL